MGTDTDSVRVPSRVAHRFAAALCMLSPVAFTALFMDVIACYWSFLGVEAPGAGCGLIGVYAPLGLGAFVAASLIVFFGSRRRLIGPWTSFGLSLLAIIATLGIAFALEVHAMSDYPRDAPVTTDHFVAFYVQRVCGLNPRWPN